MGAGLVRTVLLLLAMLAHGAPHSNAHDPAFFSSRSLDRSEQFRNLIPRLKTPCVAGRIHFESLSAMPLAKVCGI